MKAIVYEKDNAPDVLVMREVDKPIPGNSDVLVKVHASSINAADYRSLRLGVIPKSRIFGVDMAGIVEAVGAAVSNFKPGDEVLGEIASSGSGGFAEYVVVPERLLVLKPASVSFHQAAAVPMASLTALQALRDKGNIQPGLKVLIYGAGGGVGNFAVQFAKVLGANVTAVCSEKNVEIIRSMGADRVVDYAKLDILESGERFDLILNVNGSHPLMKYRRALTPTGVFVMVGGALTLVFKTMIFGPLFSLGGKKMCLLNEKANTADLDWIINLVADGKVHPHIDSSYPLSETAAAMRYVGQGQAHGKVIITVI